MEGKMSIEIIQNQSLKLDLEKTFGLATIINKLNSYCEEDKALNRDRIIFNILLNTSQNKEAAAKTLLKYVYELFKFKEGNIENHIKTTPSV